VIVWARAEDSLPNMYGNVEIYTEGGGLCTSDKKIHPAVVTTRVFIINIPDTNIVLIPT
jgi:hypothetical protein